MGGDSVTELAASACAFACPASCSNQGVPVFFGQAGEYPTPASASDVLEWCTNCDQTTVQGSSSRTFNFWIRQANLASSGMHYVAVYGSPYNRQAYASSSTSFQFETSYERFFEDESPALSLSPSLILTLLVSLLSLFVVMF